MLLFAFSPYLLSAEEAQTPSQQVREFVTPFDILPGVLENELFTAGKQLGEAVLEAEETHCINFNEVPIIEFIRFVSRITLENFIFHSEDLQFHVTLSSGKPATTANILQALFQMLRSHGFDVSREEDYHVIHRMDRGSSSGSEGLSKASRPSKDKRAEPEEVKPYEFFVHKLQYHQGGEIQEAIKKIGADLKNNAGTPSKVIQAIESIQWVKTTNSLLYSGDEETLVSLKKLVASLDVPLRQVFIEVLVIETDVRKSMEFGLQWALGGQIENKVGFGMGNFPVNGGNTPFAGTMQGINGSCGPTGLNQIPIGTGFDMGVIGDIIMHKGKSYLSLGSLVSALQIDGESTIVLNQKIITQDNKNSTIFVGDNIPFTGSVVQTVGQSQQTTANIEYRDIGVNLSITPMLGEGDIITLDLDEEITESTSNFNAPTSNTTVNGIRTTKTNMVTHVHVPDKHFLVLSGMIRNAKAHHKSGLPCLGGLPIIGAAFSKTREQDEKRNVIIFVRPHIVRTIEDFKKITQNQKEIYDAQSQPADFEGGLRLLGEKM